MTKKIVRSSELQRNTSETEIKASVNLDGVGEYNIYTGIGFLIIC